MVPIYINGLCPGIDNGHNADNDGTRVGVFDIDVERGAPGREILLRYADTNGAVEADIPNQFIGKQLKVVIRDPGFKFLEGIETVRSYGLVYTARLEIDRAYNGTLRNADVVDSWNSESHYSIAQDAAHKKVREFRHRNHIAIAFHIFVVLVSAFLGLYVSGLIGVMASLVAALILELTAPFSAGIEPFRLTRRSTQTAKKAPKGPP